MAASAFPAVEAGTRPPLRIALVVQRYGLEVNGGAELLARRLAERLACSNRVDVLTSCAVDYTTWAAHYPAGESVLGDVTVRRFAHPMRDTSDGDYLHKAHRVRYRLRRLLQRIPGGAVGRPIDDDEADGVEFLRRQGPHSVGLLNYLSTHRSDYAAGIFFSALYEPAAAGALIWGRGSILVPTLHDEKKMYLPHFRRVFAAAERVFYLTSSEQRLACRLYGLPPTHGEVVGAGIDARPAPDAVRQAVQRRHRLPARYLVYVGRIDVGKGCDELLAALGRLDADEAGPSLVLVGQLFMPLPAHRRLFVTGFVGDDERNAIVEGASALVMPSRHESLSMVLLEAMALGVPVLANAASTVLADHVKASGAGWLYCGPRELSRQMLRLAGLGAAARQRLGDAGRRYVADRYGWPQVISRYQRAIDSFSAGRSG